MTDRTVHCLLVLLLLTSAGLAETDLSATLEFEATIDATECGGTEQLPGCRVAR